MRRPTPTQILAVVAFGVFIAADDLTVVSTMLRQIIFDLEIPLPEGLNQAAWIVNAYLIAYVVVMPFIGRLSDILGRRVVYVGALLLFLIGSIWVPLASSFNSFIVGRVISALGGGAMVPVAMAVIGDVYAPRKRATALGSLGAIDTAGWVWGPLYGALLIRFLNWRWQFYLNIPLSLIGIGLAWWALADLPRPAKKERVDWWGTAVITTALLTLNIALLNSGDVQSVGGFANLSPTTPTNSLPLYLISIVMVAAFITIQQRLGKGGNVPPLIDLILFKRPNFSAAILLNSLIGFVLIIVMVNVPLVVNVLQFDVQGAALTSGYLLSGMTGSMALMAYVGGRLTEKVSYRPVVVAGLLFCTVGFGLLGYFWTIGTPFGQVGILLAVMGVGFGLVMAPLGTAVINAAPTNQRGIASSLVILMRLMGMSIGLSSLTAWGLRRFNHLRTQIQLPDLPLTDPAYQKAIVDGLTQVTVQTLTETFLISAGIVVMALIVAIWLRRDDFVL